MSRITRPSIPITQVPSRVPVLERPQSRVTQDVDTFVRQSALPGLRFGSTVLPTYAEFQLWLEGQGLNLAKLGPWLTTVMTDTNRLGEGGEARGYEIPGNDRFVLRCATSKAKAIEGGSILRKAALAQYDDPFPHLNIGQAVATIGPVQVLKRQTGFSISMPQVNLLTDDPARFQQTALIKAKRMLSVPQEGFNALAELREYLRQSNYLADADKDNVLLSEDGQRFLQLDVVKKSKPLPPLTVQSLLATCLYPLPPKCRQNGTVQQELEATNRAILGKCIIAAKHAGYVPLERNTAIDSVIRRQLDNCGLKADADLSWFYAQL